MGRHTAGRAPETIKSASVFIIPQTVCQLSKNVLLIRAVCQFSSLRQKTLRRSFRQNCEFRSALRVLGFCTVQTQGRNAHAPMASEGSIHHVSSVNVAFTLEGGVMPCTLCMDTQLFAARGRTLQCEPNLTTKAFQSEVKEPIRSVATQDIHLVSV